MELADFIEAWWLSVRQILEPAGVVGRFERSPRDRLNPSCSLNLRRNELEADLVIWESGEAEYIAGAADGSFRQQHFDDIRKQPDLGDLLSHAIRSVLDNRSDKSSKP